MTTIPARPDVRDAELDPISFDIFWTRLIAMLNEQAIGLQRTAFSPLVREAGDCSVGIFALGGRLIAQAVTGTPGHIFALPACIKYLLREYPLDQWADGDVFITNEPYENCGHQYDVTIATPVFHHGKPIAVYGSTAHVLDIGGRPLSSEASDVFEEGLIIPAMRWMERGKLNSVLHRIITANVRTPEEVLGDIDSLVGTNEAGRRRVVGYMDELGLNEIGTSAAEMIRRSERAMRDAITRLPDGVYQHVVRGDGFEDGEEVIIAVSLTISGDHLIVDFTGSSAASPKGINVVFNYTNAYTIYALKCALAPDVPNNEGSLAPITVVAPQGSLLNAVPPAPVGMRHVIGHLIPSAIFCTLGQAVPERVIADGAAAVWMTTVRGTMKANQTYLTSWLSAGGMGARPTKDGLNCTAFPTGTRAVPMEILESLSPIIIRRRELIQDSGGPGKYRGGCGQRIDVQLRSETPGTFISSTERVHHPPEGMAGGGPGRRGALHNEGRALRLKATNPMNPGDIFTLELPGGGGYGNPAERDPRAVVKDVVLGFVSEEAALRDYGVVIVNEGEGWDAESTRKARLERSERSDPKTT